MLYHGNIVGVKYSLTGTDKVYKDSYALINSSDLFRNNLPYPKGVYDAHTGTTSHDYKCQTCFNKKKECLGHEGHIVLNYPVWNPIAAAETRKWLKVICFSCGYPVIKESLWRGFPRLKWLDNAAKIASTIKEIECIHCGVPHPNVKKDNTEPLMILIDGDIKNNILYPHQIGKILSKITDETVIAFGKNPISHPRNFILYAIKVPPVTIRPDVKKIGGGRSTNDDLTSMLQGIIKRNDEISPIIPDIIDPKLDKKIFGLNNAYYDFVRAGTENGMNSIAMRLKGKKGRFRRNQLGKRVHMMCRSTIIGSTQIKLDEVGIPLVFARTMQMEVVVQSYNIEQLSVYVQNGRERYPGATVVVKAGSGKEIGIKRGIDIVLEYGDTVYRDIISGDPVNFNRQPSLKVSNISTHKAIVIPDPMIKTLVMNVIVCALYDADFDGDQMNLIVAASTCARNEMSELASIDNWIVSHTSSSPPIGQVDDSIIGTAELTRTGVRLDKYHAMLLFQKTTISPSFADVKPVVMSNDKQNTTKYVSHKYISGGLTGRECVSKVFEQTPINFTRVPEWYQSSKAAYINYIPEDIKVVISQGKLLSGILDKKSIGKGSAGGIYHIVANEYSAKKALELMYNMQQMAIAYILQFGYTIGIMDLMINNNAKKEIEDIANNIINKSQLITEELHNNEIIPPIGKTIEEFYEERQINTLSIFEDFNEPILKAINHNTNNLFKLIMFGSKGKMEQMFNMVSSIGQKLINGERIRQTFGFKRTLVYYPRFDTTPESRGYINNSFLNGMDSIEYLYAAMAARFDLITKALSTSITGEQNRKSIKNLESIITNNFRQAVKNRNIVQLAYGDNFIDPRRVEKVKFSTVLISDAEFAEKFKHSDFPDFFDQMKQDRDYYRKQYLQIEHMNINELISDERNMPVHIARIVADSIREYQLLDEDNKKTPKDLSTKEIPNDSLSAKVQLVDEVCRKFPYLLINDIQERLEAPIPEYIESACKLMCILIRSNLHPNVLSTIDYKTLLIIIDKIKLRYTQALIEPGTTVGIIAAQSFSAPLTQYMLDAHHRSASGGTSKSSMTRVKEILGARPPEKLKAPSMLIPILPEYSHDINKVREIANNIEVMKVRQFVESYAIYYEKFGEPIHSKTIHESNLIANFLKHNPNLKPPADLVKWCIRLVLNKTAMILKNMNLELIVTKLREYIPELYIVYTPENSDEIIVRIYMRNTMFKHVDLNTVINVKDQVFDKIIRGVSGILITTVVKMLRNKINPDGSISRDENQYGIKTLGSNLRGVLNYKHVDTKRVLTDVVMEMCRVFGIEAGMQKIMSEMRLIMDVACNHCHYGIYANEMTSTGKVTSIESGGLKAREQANVLLRIGASSPMAAIEDAAINASVDEISGVTAPFLIGRCPRIGTTYNTFHINGEFVKANVVK